MIFLISHGCVDAFQLFLVDDCFFKALIKAIAKTAGTIANPALFCPCEIITQTVPASVNKVKTMLNTNNILLI